MTDFFSGLLQRSAQQQGNVLQRRRPSRFEPSPGAHAMDGAGPGIDEIGPEISSAAGHPFAATRNELPRSGSIAQRQPGQAPDHDKDLASRQVEGDPMMSGQTPQHGRIESDLARLAEVVAGLSAGVPKHSLLTSSATQSASPRVAMPTAEPDVVDQRAVFQVEMRDPIAPRVSAPAAAPHPAAPAQVMVREVLRTAPTEPPPRASGSSKPEPVGARTTASLQPRVAPLPRPAAATTTARRVIAAPAAPAVPAVHVSIGRIEIRAVPSSAPTKSSRSTPAAGPRLSLDDYLKARDGGQR